jgi:hypothetical protein
VHPDFVVTVAAVMFLALTANITAFLRFWAVFTHLRRSEPPAKAPPSAEKPQAAEPHAPRLST